MGGILLGSPRPSESGRERERVRPVKLVDLSDGGAPKFTSLEVYLF